MISFESSTGDKKINIWKDEIPIPCVRQTSLQINKNVKNNLNWHEGIICVEALFGPLHVSNYAMVCMKYSSDIRGEVNIRINCGVDKSYFLSYVLPDNKKISVGLEIEFANAIKEFFKECPTSS